MAIILVGLNHRTAPVEIRERLSLGGCGLDMALTELHAPLHPHIHGRQDACPEQPAAHPPVAVKEAIILSTCNRLEVYAVTAERAEGWAAVESFLSTLENIPLEALRPHLYRMGGEEVVAHLMRVATGLDSMVLGEPQILGQVSAALSQAQGAGTNGPLLTHLFNQAIHAGKRARTETAISRHTTSVSHAAALLIEQRLGVLSDLHVLLIGAGEMAEVAAGALQQHGAAHIVCINRTYSRAAALAETIHARAANWHDLRAALAEADVVLTATGAPHIVVEPEDVAAALPQRDGRPLMFMDIAVPRDVDVAVDSMPGVTRYDIDDLQSILDDNLAQREAAVPEVEALIAEEIETFLLWLHSRQVAPLIADLRRKAARLAAEEAGRALNRMEGLTPHNEDVVQHLAHRIVNRLLHEPTVRLKEQAADGNGYEYAHMLRELFALSVDADAVSGAHADHTERMVVGD